MIPYHILQLLEEFCDACGPERARTRLMEALDGTPQNRALRAIKAALSMEDATLALTHARAVAGIREPV